MAPDMFRSFGEIAKKRGEKPISGGDMDLIMWKNTARLWKIKDPKPHVKR